MIEYNFVACGMILSHTTDAFFREIFLLTDAHVGGCVTSGVVLGAGIVGKTRCIQKSFRFWNKNTHIKYYDQIVYFFFIIAMQYATTFKFGSIMMLVTELLFQV